MKKAKPHVFWSPRRKVWIAMVEHQVQACGSPKYGWFYSIGYSVSSATRCLTSRRTRCFSEDNPQTRFGYQT